MGIAVMIARQRLTVVILPGPVAWALRMISAVPKRCSVFDRDTDPGPV
jgi:hypothetical protein